MLSFEGSMDRITFATLELHFLNYSDNGSMDPKMADRKMVFVVCSLFCLKGVSCVSFLNQIINILSVIRFKSVVTELSSYYLFSFISLMEDINKTIEMKVSIFFDRETLTERIVKGAVGFCTKVCMTNLSIIQSRFKKFFEGIHPLYNLSCMVKKMHPIVSFSSLCSYFLDISKRN